MIHRQNEMHMGKWKFHLNSHWTTERLAAEQRNPKANGKLGMGFNVRNPKVLPLVKDCIDEFYELFDHPKLFHIGVDEAHYFGESWPKEINRGVAMANYLNTLNRYIKKKGARTVMWGDMLLSHASMPYFFEHNGGPPLNTAEALPLLDDDIIISDWHYGYTVAGVVPEHYPSIPWFRKHGHDVIPVPWFNTKNMLDMARDSIATESKGLMGSSWSFHMAYRLYAYPDAFHGKADLRRQITRNREMGILSSIAEVAWRPFHAKAVMEKYDSVQWELRWFPDKNIIVRDIP
ncbi:MAG: family 20 glycosylhydrolase [Phycisphaeraceae bacterium]|nr:family 20 glycosylhydrolase [Phycisphaeraceae bacterium]